MKIDDRDIKILTHLLTDARQSASQLAHRLDISTVTVITRLKKLEENKIIRGYSARLNHELLGYEITAIIEIKTTQ
ncbi:MAG: Lrp/AsnC family transcriptional regulator, partial [Nitrosopumilus sp.]